MMDAHKNNSNRRKALPAVWIGLSLVIGLWQPAAAVSPRPDILERLQAEGRLDEYARLNQDARRRGLDQADPQRLAASAAPVLGNLRALVILVDFTDHPATAGAATDTAFFRDLLFSSNVPGRSLRDYYDENSYGKVTVDGDVVGWLRMPQLYSYYVDGQRGLGDYPRNAQRLAQDAVLAAEAAGVDFSLYDNDNNGLMDGFFVVHSGPGYEETGNNADIHSHKWVLQSSLTFDGVTISNYTMQPEEQGDLSPINIGVFCHEFGHFLGLPDLYDTDGSSQGLDKWVLMAAGNWARLDGSSPAHLGPWSKIRLGWLTPIAPVANLTGATIPAVETDTVVYRLWTAGTASTQYFLVENRQKVGFDAYLPASGLLVYHIDDAVAGSAPNNFEWYPGYTAFGHYKIALEQADGLYELEKSPGTGPLAADGGDPWPGGAGNTSFDDLSVPDTRDYFGIPTQVAVWNISAPGPVMTANLDVTWSRPNLQLRRLNLADNGNADGVPDPGETIHLFVTYRNLWLTVTDAELSVSSEDGDLAFTDSLVMLGLVSSGDSVTNTAPITFSVPTGKIPRISDFYITVTALSGSYVRTDTVRIDIGPKQLLLVDDDGRLGAAGSADSTFIVPVLEARRIPYDRWEVYSQGVPSTMNSYPVVLWYTGNARSDLFGGPDTIITPGEVNALQSFMDAGGSLFMTGQQIARYLDSMNATFLSGYLRASYGGPANDFQALGIEGDPVSDSTRYVLAGAGGAGNQTNKDLVFPTGGAVAVFTEEANASNVTGIRYDGAYRLLFLGWGVEGIGDDVAYIFDADPKSVLINRGIEWLLAVPTAVGDEEDGLRPVAFDLLPNYPNPFNPSTTIGFVVGPDPGRVTLTIYNLLGQAVQKLVDADHAPGRYEVVWDGRSAQGSEVSSGVYFYRLEAGGRASVRKMLMLK